MSKILEAFRRARQEKRHCFVSFLTGGYPEASIESTTQNLEACISSGADIIEIGVPFSDPSAEGPVIQESSRVANDHGIDISYVLRCAAEIRKRGHTKTGIILMGYYNNFFLYPGDLAQACKKNGVDGLIIVDLPPECAARDGLYEKLVYEGIALIPIVTKETSDERLRILVEIGKRSFCYCISVSGVTGSRKTIDLTNIQNLISRIRKLSPSVNCGIGFGVSSPETVQEFMKTGADGVIVGSALITKLKSDGIEGLKNIIRDLAKTVVELKAKPAESDCEKIELESNFTKSGHFGDFGGTYLPEILISCHERLLEEFEKMKIDDVFLSELQGIYENYVGRPTSLYFAKNLTQYCGGAKIYLKREDLAHTGAHKINNALGQCLLAKKMGKTRIICETGAGQHGVATATACAMMQLQCVVYMGTMDMERQASNVFKMKVLGAEVVSVDEGSKGLKDAVNAAIRDWVSCVDTTHYCLGSAVGSHPFPKIVQFFQRRIGDETRKQILKQENKLPQAIVACVGGGSNAVGMFTAFLDDDCEIYAIEAGGTATSEADFDTKPGETAKHAAAVCHGRLGVFQGQKTFVLQDAVGQITPCHSISAGLGYSAVGPQLANFSVSGRVKFLTCSDDEAVKALILTAKVEGIIPALESSHAIAKAMNIARTKSSDEIVVINISGRGDKDIPILKEYSQSCGLFGT